MLWTIRLDRRAVVGEDGASGPGGGPGIGLGVCRKLHEFGGKVCGQLRDVGGQVGKLRRLHGGYQQRVADGVGRARLVDDVDEGRPGLRWRQASTRAKLVEVRPTLTAEDAVFA